MEQIFVAKENPVLSVSINKNSLSINNSTIKKNARKVVLGKLDNVLHQNQPTYTPYKSDSISCAKSDAKFPHQNFHRHYLSIPEINLKVTSSYLGLYSLKYEVCSHSVNENLFEYMDFSNTMCLNNCWRPIAEIWLDNQSGKDTFAERVLNHLGGLVEICETECFFSICNDFCDKLERDNCSKDNDTTGTEHCEYKLDSHMPMPNLDDTDIPF